jgi:hypothetical protein
MARKLPPPPDGWVLVKSNAYGEHYRRKRGSIKPAELNDALKLSNALMADADVYAKAIKDALDPFREKFEDGTMWSRLVKLFKKQLKKNGRVELKALEEFECHKRFHLRRILHRQLSVSMSDQNNTLEVEAMTYGALKARWEKADDYRQILIVVFYDTKLDAKVSSDTVILPLGKTKRNVQKVSLAIPDQSVTAIITLRCDFWRNEGTAGGNSRRGMEILQVVDLQKS